MRGLGLMVGLVALASVGGTGVASAAKPSSASYTPVGDFALVGPGYKSKTAVQLSSLSSGDYGLVSFAVPTGMTLSQLNKLATEYEFLAGSSCWQGSPRFDVGVNDPTYGGVELHFVIGSAPSYTNCPAGTWLNSGNLASPTSLVDDSALGGSYDDPYANTQASHGTDPVTSIELVVDGFAGGSQTAEFDNTQVNQQHYTYEK